MDRATAYLNSRQADYTKRKPRYVHTAEILAAEGPHDTHTLVDVAAGWTQLDNLLRTDLAWKGRYLPVDMAIDGTDIEHWAPHLDAEWFVALEILEHLTNPERLVCGLQTKALNGVMAFTPNPAVVDVFVMDATHHWGPSNRSGAVGLHRHRVRTVWRAVRGRPHRLLAAARESRERLMLVREHRYLRHT